MRGMNLKALSAEVLIDLRNDIDRILSAKVAAERSELQSKLDKLEKFGRPTRGGRISGRSHPLKGAKVEPRFRGPDGQTWSGRGLRPRWLSALIDQGRSIEEFAINRTGGGKVAKKRVGRRGRK